MAIRVHLAGGSTCTPTPPPAAGTAKLLAAAASLKASPDTCNDSKH